MQFASCEPGKTRIGWIGAGVMGAPMCGHLLDAGYTATIHTRTRSKAEALIERGATWAETPRAVAEASDVVFAIVSLPGDVREVFLGDAGAISAARAGMIFVDMTTSEPSLAVELDRAAKANGAAAVDAPVSGGDVGAREAKLAIMVGGDTEAVEAVRPCFDVLGKAVGHQGPAGAGQHTKMVNQMLIAPMMIGVCEGLLYAIRAGLDPMKVIETVGSGAAGSWSINNYGPRIVRRDFEPGFFVEHFLKDMQIALREARALQLSLPGLALAEQLYRAVEAQGYGRKGTQALMLALEQLSGGHPSTSSG